MKRISFGVAAILAIFTILAIPVMAQEGHWRLVHAEYGAGNSWADVTPQVRGLIRDHALNMRADNYTLGGDPAPGLRKTLRLRIDNERGETKVLNFPEKSVVQLAVSARFDNDDRDRDHRDEHHDDHADARRDERDPHLHITRASYGAEGHFFDVTGLLNSNVRENRLIMPINNDTMGGDPAYGAHKSLHVWYRFGDRDAEMTVAENTTLALPDRSAFPDAGRASFDGDHHEHDGDADHHDDGDRREGLRIVRAEYGAEGHFADVTRQIRSVVNGDRLEFYVSNDSLGGDPAPGLRKQLHVIYFWQGERHEAVAAEGATLAIP